MPLIQRNPASCGSQILTELNGCTVDWLRTALKPTYRNYEQREDDGSYREGYDGDGDSDFIYGGETIVFSDADRVRNGARLAELIAKHNLGELTSISTVNPNTRHPITTWLWRYNGNVLPEVAVKLPKAAVVKPVQAENVLGQTIQRQLRNNRR